MDLKEFTKKVVADIVSAVDESNNLASREVTLAYRQDRRTIEFDVAVSAEETSGVTGQAGVRVLAFMEAGGDVKNEYKNSTVSRVTFGVDVGTRTKAENQIMQAQWRNQSTPRNPAI